MSCENRVTFFINTLTGGGAERVTCNLANYFCEVGYLVDVITMSDEPNTYKLDNKINRVCLLKRNERSGKLKDYLLRERRLKEYVINNQNVKCYIVMLPATTYMLMRLKKHTKSKIIMAERNNPSSYGLFNKKMARYSAKHCDGLVVQTGEIGGWYKNNKNKVIIPNAINDDVVFPKRDKIEKKIVAVGRLKKQKNYPMLVKAFEIFSNNHPDYCLEIYGKGDQEKSIRKLIDKTSLTGRVKLMGYVNDVSERIANAACFVMTSNYEGMPNALIEAMCIGIPCVATDCDGGGVRELIENGVNGFLVEKGAIEELSTRMSEIVDDKQLSEKLSCNTIKTREKLNSKKIYKKWAEYIDYVCGVKK